MTGRDTFQESLQTRYLLERELGRGGMATVYLARDLKHDRLVALKVLHPELAAILGPERFQREIRLAARLQHPHILSVHDSGEAAGHLWFTMPYVEGESLRDRLCRERQLPLEDAVRIMREAAAAVDYAHRHGVVHRDIKPENILLTRDGDALVADFGVARALGGRTGGPADGRTEVGLTETGMTVGTPAYMSPEQASGSANLDARTDVYSLGCVLYEMLAGEPPFTGPTAQAIMAKRLSGEIPPVRRVRSVVSEALDRVIAKALALVPADRFQTTAEFASATGSAAAGNAGLLGTLPTIETTTPPQTPPAGYRPRARSTIPLVVGLLIAGTMGVLLWRRSQRPSESPASGLGAPPTVAVLYLKNLSADTSDAYLGDGLTEEITSRLGQIQRLRVKARGAVRRFRDSSADDPGVLGRALGVDYLLEGSVRRAGDRVRVSVGLVKSADGFQTWGDDYDRPVRDVLALQQEIAQQVVTTIAGRLAPEDRTSLTRKPTDDPEAYDHYLRGQYYLSRRSLPNLARAIEEYRAAVRLDPRFAAALGRIGYAYGMLDEWEWRYPALPADSLVPWGMNAANRALTLDSTSSDAWLARGWLVPRLYPESSAVARPAFERAVALDSTNAEARLRLGTIQLINGEDSAAFVSLHRTLALDPGHAVALLLIGVGFYYERNYREASRWFDSSQAVDPTRRLTYVNRALCRLQLGDTAGALADRRSAIESPDAKRWVGLALAPVAIAGGERASIEAGVRSILQSFPRADSFRHLTGGQRRDLAIAARASAALGNFDVALDLLERLKLPGTAWSRFPEYDPIRKDPRFQRLVDQARAKLQPSAR